MKEKKEFLAALVVIVMVLATLALPYALTEAYGLKVKKLILLMHLILFAVFSAGMLTWWLVRRARAHYRCPLAVDGDLVLYEGEKTKAELLYLAKCCLEKRVIF